MSSSPEKYAYVYEIAATLIVFGFLCIFCGKALRSPQQDEQTMMVIEHMSLDNVVPMALVIQPPSDSHLHEIVLAVTIEEDTE